MIHSIAVLALWILPPVHAQQESAAGRVQEACSPQSGVFAGCGQSEAGLPSFSLSEPAPDELFHIAEAPPAQGNGQASAPFHESHLIHIRQDQFGRLYMLSASVEQGTGENGLYSSQILDEFAWYFQEKNGLVYLVRKNTLFTAQDGTPIQKSLDRSFQDSIVAIVPVVFKDTNTETTMIPFEAIFMSDLFHVAEYVGRTYRGTYLQGVNLEGLNVYPLNLEVRSRLFFGTPTGKDALGKSLGSSSDSSVLPDPRNFSVVVRYSVSKLPESPGFKPRPADDRIGHFNVIRQDWSDAGLQDKAHPYIYPITRWNLEKVDPLAPVSPVKKPIVFWLEDTIPQEFRAAVRNGILAWNEVFEAIGFKNAIVVKEVDKDLSARERAKFDPADARYNVIHWFVGEDAGFAIGPSRVNPLTGEIYNASVSLSASMARAITRELSLIPDRPTADSAASPGPGRRLDPLAGVSSSLARLILDGPEGLSPQGMELSGQNRSSNNRRFSDTEDDGYVRHAMQQAAFAFSLLEARGESLTPQEKKKFIDDFLTSIMAHEIGHTLGLRHNFKGSTLLSPGELYDPKNDEEFSSSVMDYLPPRIAPEGKHQGPFFQTKPGRYDRWAIEYAYKDLGAATPSEERQKLDRIASRSATEPGLAYGTDEDASGVDPDAERWDLGNDPVAFSRTRVGLARELWKKLETQLAPHSRDGYAALRRRFQTGMTEYIYSVFTVLNDIGGIRTSRSHPGDSSPAPYVPVSRREQMRALDFLDKNLFQPGALKFSPQLLRRLGSDRLGTFEDPYPENIPYPVELVTLAIQNAALRDLYHPLTVHFLTQSRGLASDPRQVLSVRELFGGIRHSIWTEVETPGKDRLFIAPSRRNLQQLHVLYLDFVLRKPMYVADSSEAARADLVRIYREVNRALAEGRPDPATRAHLVATRDKIHKILKRPLL